MLAERPLADERCCWELAEHAANFADLALANKRHHHEAAKHAAVLAEYDAQTNASQDTAVVEAA